MNRPSHVCILTSAHPLDDVRVSSKIASSFLDRGFTVSWVGPDLSFFKRRSDLDPRIDYHLTEHGSTKLDRLLSARRVVRKAAEVRGVDWYYCPDPDAAGAAVGLARRTGARVVFDIHEVYHGARLNRWLPGPTAEPVRELVRRRIAATCRRSDLVIGVSGSVLAPYVTDEKPGVPVRNCAPRWFEEFAERTDGRRAEGITFMHGKALPSNGTSVVLDAAALLDATALLDPTALRDDTTDGTRVLMFRSGSQSTQEYQQSLADRIAALHLTDRVQVHDSVTHERMPDFLARCDVGVIAYGRDLGERSLPNRLFEYMAAGLAVLAPSYAVDIKAIVDDEGIGLTADFESPEEVAEAMRWFGENRQQTEEMGRLARKAFLERHNWDAEFDRLTEAMGAARP